MFNDATASERWVGITVKGIGPANSDVNILPRLRLLTSPYAFLASKALSVDGAGLTSGTVSDTRLSTNVALLTNGTLIDARLSTNVALLNRPVQNFSGGTNTFSGKVFVYGREVKDFRTVDYEAIAMLNVSATQELARKLAAKDAELTKLRAELTELRTEKGALADKLAAVEARDQTLEDRLVRLELALQESAAGSKGKGQVRASTTAPTRELSSLAK